MKGIEINSSEHKLTLFRVEMTGVGFNVSVNTSSGPTQPLLVGVTVMVDTILEPVLFVAAVKLILFDPLAGKPIAVLLFVQL